MNKLKPEPSTDAQEWVSELFDDALTRWPLDQPLDDALLQQWRQHVVVSQVMRGEPTASTQAQDQLLAALRVSYAQPRGYAMDASPAQAAPVKLAHKPATAEGSAPQYATPPAAANEGVFAWPWAAALVLAVGAWMAWPASETRQAVVASAETSVPAVSLAAADPPAAWVQEGGVIRDPRLDALLQSHRQSGLGSALQYPAGFVRSVALER